MIDTIFFRKPFNDLFIFIMIHTGQKKKERIIHLKKLFGKGILMIKINKYMKVNKIERVVNKILCKYHLDGYVEVEYFVPVMEKC